MYTDTLGALHENMTAEYTESYDRSEMSVHSDVIRVVVAVRKGVEPASLTLYRPLKVGLFEGEGHMR